MKYTRKKDKFVKTNETIEFLEKNSKGERLVIELCEIYPDNTIKNSLPNLWKKHGHTKGILKDYLILNTYAYLKNGECRGLYNPTHTKDFKLDFNNVLRVSEENKQILIKKCYELFKNSGVAGV